MLLGQNGGRHQVHHLLALLHGFEGSPDSNLRLAIPNIAADQAVHNLRALHIRFRIRNGSNLILRLLKGKHFLKFPLPYRILFKRISFTLLAQGVKLYQIVSHFVDGTADLRFGSFPFFRTQFVQLRLPGVCGSVFLDNIQPGSQHIQISPIPVLNLDVVFDHTLHLHLFNPLIDSQTVAFMHHIIPHLQLIEILDFLTLIELLGLFLLFLRTENVCLRQHHELQHGILEALIHMTVTGDHLPRQYFPQRIFRIHCGNLLVPQILRQALCPGPGAGQQENPVPVLFKQLQILHQCLEAVVI